MTLLESVIYKNDVNLKLYQNRDWLYNQYITLGKSMQKIADECECTQPTIRNWLKKFGIQIRTISEAWKIKCENGYKNNLKLYQNRDWLYKQCVELKKSISEIMEITGASYPTISKWVKKFGILILKGKGRGVKCEICDKCIVNYRNPKNPYKYTTFNLLQNPSKHYFCSEKCKENFVYRDKSINLNTVKLNQLILKKNL